MPYIGNSTSTLFTSMAKQDITGDGGASYTLTHAVANEQEIEVFVNNVRQEPGVAYTVSGTALTMTGNVASTDDFYVVYQGKAVATTNHPSDSPLAATSGTFSSSVSATTGTFSSSVSGTTGTFSQELTAEGRSILPLQKGGDITGSYDLDTFPPNSVGYYNAGSNATNRGFSNNGMMLSLSTRLLDATHDSSTDERAAQLYFGDTNQITTQSGGSTGGFWYRPKQGTVGYHRWGRVPISSTSNTVIQCISTAYSGFASTTNSTGITFADLDMSPVHPDSYILVVAHVNGHSQDDSEANLEYNKTNTSGTETGWTRDNKLNGNGTRKCIGDFAWTHNSNHGNHHCGTSILADFGTDMKRIRIRIRVSAENNVEGGCFINTGKGGNSTGGYNFDTAKCTLTMYEIARGGTSGGVNLG